METGSRYSVCGRRAYDLGGVVSCFVLVLNVILEMFVSYLRV